MLELAELVVGFCFCFVFFTSWATTPAPQHTHTPSVVFGKEHTQTQRHTLAA